MESGTVEWPVPPSAPRDEAAEAGGLRERKKRLMLQQLSGTQGGVRGEARLTRHGEVVSQG
jgi:hypothetical protein